MDFLDFLRAVMGLAVTLGLIGLAVWAARRYAPGLLARLQGGKAGEKKRMSIVETVVLGPAQRLVLVRVDEEERLILLGEGREITGPQEPKR